MNIDPPACRPRVGDETRETKTDLFLYVIERVRRVDSEADEDDVRIWVAERSQPIIVFLTSRIP